MSTDTLARSADTTTPMPRRGLPTMRWLLRQQRRGTLGWAIALAIVCAIYVSFYPAMGGDQGDLSAVIDQMPDALVTALGYDTIGTAPGYLESTVFGSLGPALLLVFVIAAGARLIGGEEEDGTLELELTLPVTRRRAILERYLVLVTRLALLSAVVLLVVLALVTALDMAVTTGNIAATTLGLFLISLAMGTVAFAAGAATGRRSIGVAAGAGFAVASYIADALAPLAEGAAWLADISPFSWYLAGEPLVEGIDWAGNAGLLALVVVVLAAGTLRFERRDLGV